MPRVFVSYSHDSEIHRRWVWDLASRLRADGVDAWIDQYDPWPVEGWPVKIQAELAPADYVLCVCTSLYAARFEQRTGQEDGRGVAFEAGLLIDALYDTKGRNDRFIAVIPPGSARSAVPGLLRRYSHHALDEGYPELLARLLGQAPTVPPVERRALETPLAPRSRGAAPEPERLDFDLALRAFLTEAFDVGELRLVARKVREGLHHHLPEGTPSRVEVVDNLIRQSQKEGLVRELVVHVRSARPGREPEVDALRDLAVRLTLPGFVTPPIDPLVELLVRQGSVTRMAMLVNRHLSAEVQREAVLDAVERESALEAAAARVVEVLRRNGWLGAEVRAAIEGGVQGGAGVEQVVPPEASRCRAPDPAPAAAPAPSPRPSSRPPAALVLDRERQWRDVVARGRHPHPQVFLLHGEDTQRIDEFQERLYRFFAREDVPGHTIKIVPADRQPDGLPVRASVWERRAHGAVGGADFRAGLVELASHSPVFLVFGGEPLNAELTDSRVFDALVLFLQTQMEEALRGLPEASLRVLVAVHEDGERTPTNWAGRIHAVFDAWAREGLVTYRDTDSRVVYPSRQDVLDYVERDCGLLLGDEERAKVLRLHERHAAAKGYADLCAGLDTLLASIQSPSRRRG